MCPCVIKIERNIWSHFVEVLKISFGQVHRERERERGRARGKGWLSREHFSSPLGTEHAVVGSEDDDDNDDDIDVEAFLS